MYRADEEIIGTKIFKNNLEAYVYDMRSKITGDWAGYIDEQSAAAFIEILNQAEVWLYGEGRNATLAVYQEKDSLLRGFGDPVTNRFRTF